MLLTRREFLVRSAAATAVAGFAARVDALDIPLGFQVHAVRARAAIDLPGTLTVIASMGYDEVELVSFKGYASSAARDGFGPLAPLSPAAIRSIIRDAGLTAISAHFKFEEFQDATFGDRIEWAHGVGLRYMTVSDLPPQPTAEEWKRVFDSLNAVGARVRAEGMQLGLHTQNDFWRDAGGKKVMDALLEAVDPRHCRVQLDLSTTQAMRIDPVNFLRRHAGRCFSVHLRDAPAPAQPGGYVYSVPLGDGDLDLRGILAAARAGGITNYIVEMQVQAPTDPVDALHRSVAFMRGLHLER